jgi:hypothetical protein
MVNRHRAESRGSCRPRGTHSHARTLALATHTHTHLALSHFLAFSRTLLTLLSLSLSQHTHTSHSLALSCTPSHSAHSALTLALALALALALTRTFADERWVDGSHVSPVAPNPAQRTLYSTPRPTLDARLPTIFSTTVRPLPVSMVKRGLVTFYNSKV